jgi:hypothetical protein
MFRFAQHDSAIREMSSMLAVLAFHDWNFSGAWMLGFGIYVE